MKPPFEVISISANEDPLYIDFWPMVAWANKVVFPECEVHLAFLTKRSEGDPYVKELRRHGPVTLWRPVPGIPDCNLVKMVRSLHCATLGDRIGYIQDIDLLPLSREWVIQKVSTRKPGTMINCGAEVYNAHTEREKWLSSCPASMMTAEGHVWKQMLNPDSLAYEELVTRWARKYARKPNEDISTKMYHEREQCFSDEKLMRSLRLETQVPITSVERGYNIESDTLDRSCWKLDRDKLMAGGYIESHLPRPLHEHRDKIEPLIEFISRKFGNGTLPLDPQTSLGFQAGRYEFKPDGISRTLLEYIFARWKCGTVLELGSGDVSTRYLAERYDITSVEESPLWLERHNSRYVHAAIVNGYYDPSTIKSAIGGRKFSFILIDGPRDVATRGRMVDFADEWRCADEVIISGACKNSGMFSAADELARRLGRPAKTVGDSIVI